MSLSGSISVVNRKGESIPMHLETISKRLDDLVAMEPKLSISTNVVALKTASSLIDGIKTSEIDLISASICASLIIDDYEYDSLAARIIVSDLHKNTYSNLQHYAESLRSYEYRDTTIGILHPKTIAFILKNKKSLHELIDYSKDYTYNYFGIITLIKSYLLAYKYDDNVKITKERPQQMLLRVAIGIHLDEISDDGTCPEGTFNSIRETYRLLSQKYYTHATPTLFNAGTINHTLSSCYLLSINDSLDNIYSRLDDISKISKFSGGVGMHVSQVRAQGSVIASTIGRSEGLVPMLRVFNESTRYVSQGGGKRKGSTAVYLEPWHADIESAIQSQQQQGIPEKLCKDLFLALWVPDLFMERLKLSIKTGQQVMWSLMCPNECKGLTDVYGEEFNQLYESYEKQKKYRKQVSIIQLWNSIVSTQIETGKPYLMYKDHVNRKCNQNSLGTIKSSNLCVAGDTKILTKTGYQEIQTLAGQNVEVWNGSEWSLAPVAQTGTDQQLLKVSAKCMVNNGKIFSLECTHYHRFPIAGDGKTIIKQADELLIGDQIIDYKSVIDMGKHTHESNYNSRRLVITSIEPVEGLHDTYCFNEPKKHMGIFNGILSMNCSEITIYSDDKQVGVCNLASICLPQFVVKNEDGMGFDYEKLNHITQRVVYNMNKVMDNNKYPIEQAKYSDDMNRPIGIGVQGLSEVFMMLKTPYDSAMARRVNSQIFETMYFAAMTASNKLAQIYGSYKSFPGSMTSKGIFQFDLWDDVILSKMWDWDELKHKVVRTGLRNSLLMCIMPTAGTSIISGHSESVEVPQSNIFTRSSLSGRFQVVNKHLVKDLKELGLWNRNIRNQIITNDGSVANIKEIPQKLRDVYKTIYEYKLSHFIEMCSDREAFVCQSSSNNRFIVDPTVSKLTKMHLYSWKMGLKTSSYYVRVKQASTGKKIIDTVADEPECLSCTA